MRHRSSRGSLLLLLICLVPLVALVFVFAVKCVAVVIAHERHVAAAQAAALTAAKDLSRIVIDDPYFGYISLADQPPIGNGTLAEDGEPLPVTGINTIIGTARLDYIIANAIGDDDLISEARMEAHQARRAAIRLSHALAKSLNQGNNQYTDLDGKKISPYKDAFETYKQNLKTDAYLSKATIDEFTLELGWLSKAATTQTPMPKPEQYASLPNGIKYSATYPGFVNLPVGNEDLYFAGLATRPALVDEHNFQLFDSQHPSTIVRVSSNVSVSLPTNDDVNLCADSCAMPFATADKQPGCCFVLSFCDGVPHRLRSLHDLLSDQSMERSQVSPLTASGGDYPDDTQAALRPAAGRTTLNRMFARGFLHWLRTAH